MSISGTLIACVAIVTWGVVRLARIRAGQPSRRELREMRKMGFTNPSLLPAEPSPREAELQREVEDLRERIKVLERITVDERQSRSVAAEIEALRDK